MIKYCQIMDYDSIVQDLVAPGDSVLSTVECSWNDSFRILALLEHPSWEKTTTAVGDDGVNCSAGQRSPDSREFAILFLDGRAPILTKNDMNAVHVIPVCGSAFTCEIDMESCGEDGEICVKLVPNLLEPEILVKMAPGNRSQNFIDEVFRAAQIATSISSNSRNCEVIEEEGTDRSNTSSTCVTTTSVSTSTSSTFPWLAFYENLVRSSTDNFTNSSSISAANATAAAAAAAAASSVSAPSIAPSSNSLQTLSSSAGSATNRTNPSVFLSASHLGEQILRASSEGELEDEDDIMPGTERESLARGMSSLKGREYAIRLALEKKQEQYIDLKGITIYVASWNVNGQSPGSICLSEWLARMSEPPDIYAIGFQELDLSKEAFLFNDTPKEAEWSNSVRAGLHPGGRYFLVRTIRLVGMMLIVFVRDEIKDQLRDICAEQIGTGLLGRMGNKGGVGVRFELNETSICFVNCHLAAHVEEFQRRNQDFHQIFSRLAFYMNDGIKYIKDHEQIFMFGDLNYRINPATIDATKAKMLIEKEKYSIILEQDQLKEQMRLGHVFAGFTEGPINYRPTYKYDPATDNWDSSEKNRAPAWCDRILFKGKNITQIDYTSQPQYKLSDHKPVSSFFSSKMKVINQVRYRKAYEEALKQMDRLENEYLPQVTVDIPGTNLSAHSNRNEIHFGRVKFMEAVRKTFTVANTGQVPVRLEFIKKLNDSYVCKEWLNITPVRSFIMPGETCEVELLVVVDKRTASLLNVGRDTLYDILVLHLESGKDIFITVAGDFERSVFGCSITALVNMSEPVTMISPGKLIELEKGKMPVNHYDIPKELWFLVDRLYKVGIDRPGLFTLSGLQNELVDIRDWMDTIPNSPIPGNENSIAESLLLLLDSFPEPVIPFSMHLRCLDSAHNYTSCKLLVRQLPPAHRNVFLYLTSFLKELLNHSEKNGLDAKILALLFGKVIIRDQNYNAKANPRMERTKATFIYQFLVNDDYGDDLWSEMEMEGEGSLNLQSKSKLKIEARTAEKCVLPLASEMCV